MFKDNNQVSTIFLLGILGLLIYCLTKPKSVSENFAASEEKKTTLPTTPQNLAKPELKSPPASPQTKPPASPQATPPVSPQAKPPASPQAAPVTVRPEVLKQVLVEAGKKPLTESKVRTENQDVFQFEASDIYNVGAELDNAFKSPIPQQARADVVDINKNNVKKYDAKDFLPKEINNKWFDTDFSQAKFNLNDDKLINTERYVIGVNTVGQSLKNASYDIRGTIPNPKFTVSPWNNSTYEPDFNLKSLC
jgi:hypothetical protein